LTGKIQVVPILIFLSDLFTEALRVALTGTGSKSGHTSDELSVIRLLT
jgi:hypothetical protein